MIHKHYRFTNLSPDILSAKVSETPSLFLPPALRQASFNHYYESTGNRFGFQINPPWEALPSGTWAVSVQRQTEHPAGEVAYFVEITSDYEKLYSADLAIALKAVATDTEVTVAVNGKREAGLAAYSDDLVETVIRSLIRESWASLEQLIHHSENEPALAEHQGNLDYVEPLAIAAGVFSAGMALGLWLWRRKRK